MKTRSIIVAVIVAVLLLAANIAEIALVFGITSSQTKQSGADHLEVVGGELENTINEACLSVMRFAVEVQPLVDNRSECEAYIRRRRDEIISTSDSGCFNAYIATEGWHYIPDFTDPEDYVVEERSWYIGVNIAVTKLIVL